MIRIIILISFFVLTACASQTKIEEDAQSKTSTHKQEKRTKEDLCKFGDNSVGKDILDILCK